MFRYVAPISSRRGHLAGHRLRRLRAPVGGRWHGFSSHNSCTTHVAHPDHQCRHREALGNESDTRVGRGNHRDAVVRFPYVAGQTVISAPAVKVIDLPGGPRNHH